MSAWNDDPLLDRIRALPRPELDARLDDRVRLLAVAALPAARRPRARQVLATALVAGGVLAYFGWAVAFVVLPRL
jgi:hypothetical protein